MKKITVTLLCLLLACSMIVAVSATGSARMSLSSSASTLSRGDTFTITVSLENDQLVSNGGVILNYDSSAFEFVSGQRFVGDFGGVDANGGIFVVGTDTAVSGKIFTVELRVKSEGAFGTYTISGEPSLVNGSGSVSCSCNAISVTVACNHNFGAATKVDDNTHESVCSVCGEKKSADHTWNDGQVTKAPTCKETGLKKAACTACGFEKEVTLDKTQDHAYGTATKVDEASHKSTCTVCGKESTVAHSWNTGTVTKQATCSQTGTRERTCTAAGCGAKKTETIAKSNNHSYGQWTTADAQNHSRTCSVCGQKETKAHTYVAWQHDETSHFQICRECKYKANQTQHIPGPAATETTDQICTVCQRILVPRTSHVHNQTAHWIANDESHWHGCDGCDLQMGFGAHEYDSDCDSNCNICKSTREVIHEPQEDWQSDDTSHWQVCKKCGEKVGFAAHTQASTVSGGRVCSVCEYVIASAPANHTHNYDAGHTEHWHECACGQQYKTYPDTCDLCDRQEGYSIWLLVCIAEALIIIALAAYLFLRKGKQNNY